MQILAESNGLVLAGSLALLSSLRVIVLVHGDGSLGVSTASSWLGRLISEAGRVRTFLGT